MAASTAKKKVKIRAKKLPLFFIVPMNDRGTLTLPKELCQKAGFAEACQVIVNIGKDGIQIRPSATYPVEIYSENRIEHFLKNTEGVLEKFGFK